VRGSECGVRLRCGESDMYIIKIVTVMCHNREMFKAKTEIQLSGYTLKVPIKEALHEMITAEAEEQVGNSLGRSYFFHCVP
jgi:hypothetical protein